MIRTKDQLNEDCIKKVKEIFPKLDIDVAGTAANTIMEAFTSSLENVYSDVDTEKRSMFVDTAYGTSLNSVGGNVGVIRSPWEDDTLFRSKIVTFPSQYTKSTVDAIINKVYEYDEVAECIYKPFAVGSGSFIMYLAPSQYTISASTINSIQADVNSLTSAGNRGLVRQAKVLSVQMKVSLVFSKDSVANQDSVRAQCAGVIINHLNNLKVSQALIINQLRTEVMNVSKSIYDINIDYIRVNGSNIIVRNYYPAEFEILRPASNSAALVS